MPINVYLINRTYVAQDMTTGLTAEAPTEQEAIEALTKTLEKYWEKKRVVVPVIKQSTPKESNGS